MTADTRLLWASMSALARAGRWPYVGFPIVMVAGPGGGTGCSTVTAAAGGLMALAAEVPVVAVDGCPRPWGGLAAKVAPAGSSATTFNDLIGAGAGDGSALPLETAEHFMRTGPTGLRLIAGEEGLRRPGRPLMDAAALAATLCRVRFAYATALVDSPPPPDPAFQRALDITSVLVLVCRATAEGTEHALSLLAWLRADGRDRLADRAVVVVNETSPATDKAVRAGEHRLAGQAGHVVRLPYDRLLAAPGPVDPLRLAKPTRHALLRVAAAVASGCAAIHEEIG